MSESIEIPKPHLLMKTCAVAECNRPVGKKRSKYCSDECRILQSTRNQRKRYQENKKFFPENRVCAFSGCNKSFETVTWNQKYCSSKCYMLNRKFVKNQKAKKYHSYDSVCLWCHEKTEFVPTKRFCGEHKCSYTFDTIRKRIQNIYFFDEKSVDRELARLEKLGKNYTFPKPHQQLNNFYELNGEPKNA